MKVSFWRKFKDKIWAFLSLCEKFQKFFWFAGALLMIAWVAYDTGSVVTNNLALVDNGGQVQGQMTTEELIKDAKEKNGGIIYITPNEVKYKDSNNKTWRIDDFKQVLNKRDLDILKTNNIDIQGNIKINFVSKNMGPTEVVLAVILDLVLKAGIFLLYIVFGFFILKQLKPSTNGIFGKKFYKIEKDDSRLVKIKDIAGHNNAKQEVIEIVDYLRDPSRYVKVGAQVPKGILLYGPPGNGKTMLAKAIAGEADANFLTQQADSFVELYVGQGAAAVRNLFKEARKLKPCVIFIDEIDALGASRTSGGNDERTQTLNALLSEMDGFGDNTGLVVVAATNRIEELDPALVRPGRFDRKVLINYPSRNDRYEILKVHCENRPLSGVDLSYWADQTKNFSGAELAQLVNEAAIESARQNKTIITDFEFSLAKDKIIMGVKEGDRMTSMKDKKFVAFHELGHALMRIKTGGKVEKVSISPRGLSLGVTITASNPDEEVILQTENDIFNELKVLMGGRAAEEVFCHALTGGAADDIKRASKLAKDAIQYYGFTGRGPYVPEHESLIREIEIKAAEWIKEAYDIAKEEMEKNKDKINELYGDLILEEELTGERIEKVLNQK